MPSAAVLDVEALLAPIPGDNPSGVSLRYTPTFDAIQEARRADDTLARGEWVRDIKIADWAAVIDLSTQALVTKSKDLQIAAWLTEALVKRHGFAGLRDGVRLLRELQVRFWDSLYPEIEEGDLEPRAAPLTWLNDKMPASIREIALTQSMSGERYSWLHWKESREVDNLGRRDQAAQAAALAEGKITGEQFDKAVETTPLGYYQTLSEDLNQIWSEFEGLEQVVDAQYGREAPSLLGMKTAIQDCRALAMDIIKKKGGLPVEPLLQSIEPIPEGPQQATVAAVPELQTVQNVPSPGAIGVALEPRDRADALRRLAVVADYFRRTEPHSPVAYLVQRAVRWGEMPLEQWLQDVIHDDTVLGYLRETLGLKDSGTTSGT
jgi:type VI secretion system protein ImpA